MTVTEPSDSTALSRRTSAFRFAIRCTPRASVNVTTAGIPSGIAATASATANITTSSMRRIPSVAVPATIRSTESAPIHRAICAPSASRRRSSGVFSVLISPSIVAMRPIALSAPVADTSRTPFPRTTRVPLKSGASSAFSIGADSPLSTDSSDMTPAPSASRPSAGMRSPASTRTASPGTRPRLGIASSLPSRKTHARGAVSTRSCASACSERYSWSVPRPALSSSTTPITIPSTGHPSKRSTNHTMTSNATAKRRIAIIGLRNCRRKRCRRVTRVTSDNALGPCAWSSR